MNASIVALLLGLLLTASAGRLDLDSARRQLATLNVSCPEANSGVVVVARSAAEIQSAIENHTSVCIRVVGSVGIPADELHVPAGKAVVLYREREHREEHAASGSAALLRRGESETLVNEGSLLLWGLWFQTRGNDKEVSLLPCRHAILLLRG